MTKYQHPGTREANENKKVILALKRVLNCVERFEHGDTSMLLEKEELKVIMDMSQQLKEIIKRRNKYGNV